MAALLLTEGKTQAWWPRPSLVPCDGVDSSPAWNGVLPGGGVINTYINLTLLVFAWETLKGKSRVGFVLRCLFCG